MQSSTAIVAPLTSDIQTVTPQSITMDESTTTPEAAQAVSPSISVSLASSTEGEALVTVKNTLSVPVRIKNLNVDGTLVGFTIGTEYGRGIIYPPSFKDTQGQEFNVLACNGLGSLGNANLGSSGMVDPCVRRDANLAKNELQPGETMILRYTDNPTTVTYQVGSITDLEGKDVQF